MRGLHRRRRRPAAARDDLRHAQRQGGDRRDRERVRGEGRAAAGDDLGHDHRRSGRTLSGQTLDAFYTSIRHARPFSVGLNCALGARDMRPYLAELARARRVLRQLLPERRPAERVRRVRRAARRDGALLREFAASGLVNIVGGCCGTTPDHIAAVRKAVDGVAPRPLPADSWLSLPPKGGSHDASRARSHETRSRESACQPEHATRSSAASRR